MTVGQDILQVVISPPSESTVEVLHPPDVTVEAVAGNTVEILDPVNTVVIEVPPILEIQDVSPSVVTVPSAAPVSVISVTVQGPPGPQGPAGSGGTGSQSYVHTQAMPSATWTIDHNLGYFPSVTVIDSLNELVEGEISYPTTDQVVLSFSASFGGTAYLS